MDFFEAVKKRHSYRGAYKRNPVPREDLEKIIRAGITAPSGKNAQTTEFIVVEDTALISEIAGILGKTNLKTAAALIACVVEEVRVFEGLSFHIEDCAAATENMLLAITALGYASVWLDGVLRVQGRAKKMGRLLNLPENKSLRIVLPVGVPLEEHVQKEKKSFTERAWYNVYGGKNEKQY